MKRVRFIFAALAFLSVPLVLIAALQLLFCPGDARGEGPDGQGAQAPTAGGYTLNDLYDFIVSDGARVPVPGNHAILPAGAPGEPGTSMHTIEEIMVELKKRFPSSGGSGLPDTGQYLCNDHEGVAIPCNSDECFGQDGFYRTGCPMQGRFQDNGDGTVTDRCTGLVWQKEVAPELYTWCEALSYCEDLSLGGKSDWRLPNIRELESLADYGRQDPCIDPIFPTEPNWHWSSGSLQNDADDAWVIHFGAGYVGNAVKFARYPTRAVRGGM